MKTCLDTERSQLPRVWSDPLVLHKQRKRDKRFATWKVRSLCRSGSLTAAAGELAGYKLDLVGVQEVRWYKGGTVTAGDCALFLWKTKGKLGHPVEQLLETLRYKPEGRGFDSRWRHWNFSLNMALGLTQTLTEMSTRNISQWLKAAGA